MNEKVTDAHVRELLDDWHNDARLARSSFARLGFVRRAMAAHGVHALGTIPDTAAAIRTLVRTAVAQVKPETSMNLNGASNISLLQDRLMNNKTVREIATAHGISEATYHRRQIAEMEQLRILLNKLSETTQVHTANVATDTVVLVGRDGIVASVRERLLHSPAARTIALVGTAGVGKNAITAALARDVQLTAHFHDGTLHAGLGQFGEPNHWLIHWADQLGIDRADWVGKSLAEQTRRLQMAVTDRKLMIVIDDVWNADHAQALMIGGTNAAHIITTQSPLIAHMLAGADAIKVPELDVPHSLMLLQQHVSSEMLLQAGLRLDDVERSAVFHLCGGLPKALSLLGNHLRWLIHSGQHARLRSLLNPDISENSVRLDALTQSIGHAITHLDDVQMQALHALTVFHPKPNTFSDLDAMAVAGCTAEVFGALVDLGFVEIWQERFTLHSALWQVARTADAEVERRMVSHYAFAKNSYAQYRFDIRDLENITTALDVADQRGLDEHYLQIVHNAYWLIESLAAVSLGERVLLAARRKANTAKTLARIDTELSRLRWFASDTPEARRQVEEALAEAQRSGDAEAVAMGYKTLSEIAIMDAKQDDANEYLAQALVNWQGDADAGIIQESAALRHAIRHSKFDAVRNFFVKAIPIAISKNVNSEQISIALAVKSWLMYLDGQVQIARTDLTRQLDDLKQHNYRLPNMIAHGALAYITHSMGDFDVAVQHATHVIAAADRNLSPDFTAQAYNVLALVESSRGNATKGLNVVTQGGQYALNHQAWLMLAAIRQTESTLLAMLDDLDAATNRAQHSLDLARACSNNMLAACALSQLGACASVGNAFDKAGALFDDASKTGKLNQSRCNPWTELVYRLHYGEHLIRADQCNDAKTHLTRAHALAEMLLSPEHAGRALIGLAHIARVQSDTHAARNLMKQAHDRLAAMGSALARQTTET
jgi:hypothetical protein